MEREACVCDHGFERSDLCAEIIIIIIIIAIATLSYLNYYLLTYVLQTFWRRFFLNLEEKFGKQRFGWKDLHVPQINQLTNFLDSGTGFWEFNYAGEACEARVY